MLTENLINLAPWLATVAVLCLLGAQTFMSARRIAQLEKSLRERCDTLGREQHATASASLGQGQRLLNCERKVHDMAQALDEMRQNDPLRASYDEASRLVDLGADIDDLMNTCGISRPEAELVTALRSRSKAA